MRHSMMLNNEPYNKINRGHKDIEMRLYDEKRRLINIGDIITFTNRTNMESFDVIVIGLHICNNFEELYSKFDKIRLGYNKDEEVSTSDMSKYYSNDDIDKYGVVGIEIKLI